MIDFSIGVIRHVNIR